MATGIIYQWFGDETDPAANAPTAAAATASSGAAPTNGSQMRWRDRQFSASTDQTVHLHFLLPSNYSSGGTLNVLWHSTDTTGNVLFKTAYALCHLASEGTPTDFDALAFGTVTSTSAIAVPGTAGYTKQTSIDLGVTGAHAGDILVVMFGRDADDGSDTAASVTKWREPWSLSFTTV